MKRKATSRAGLIKVTSLKATKRIVAQKVTNAKKLLIVSLFAFAPLVASTDVCNEIKNDVELKQLCMDTVLEFEDRIEVPNTSNIYFFKRGE